MASIKRLTARFASVLILLAAFTIVAGNVDSALAASEPQSVTAAALVQDEMSNSGIGSTITAEPCEPSACVDAPSGMVGSESHSVRASIPSSRSGASGGQSTLPNDRTTTEPERCWRGRTPH
jgi:hypothetical protein